MAGVFERILPSLLAFALSALGLALRASRRSRMLNRIRAYSQLADDLQQDDPERAALVRDLAKKAVDRFVDAERVSLDRRLDPSAVAAALLLVVPGVAVFAWAWTADEWWKWPLILFSGVWAVLWALAGSTQLWKAHEPDEQPLAESGMESADEVERRSQQQSRIAVGEGIVAEGSDRADY